MTDIERRIRERAYRIWEEEGRPEGREQEHWEQARFLVGLEDNAEAGRLPNPMVEDREKGWTTPPPPQPVEPIEAIVNQGEFPDRFADQGEKMPGPIPREAREWPDTAGSGETRENGGSSKDSKATKRAKGETDDRAGPPDRKDAKPSKAGKDRKESRTSR